LKSGNRSIKDHPSASSLSKRRKKKKNRLNHVNQSPQAYQLGINRKVRNAGTDKKEEQTLAIVNSR